MDTTKILVIGVAVVVVAAAAGVIVYNTTNNDKKSSELVDLEGWNDILDDARGQTVTLGFYITADPAINQSFWPYMQNEMKNKYGITVVAGAGYGPGAATTSATEIANGQTTNGTYDLIWGNTSAYNAMVVSGEHYDYVYQKANADGKQWGEIIPNSYYLKEDSERVISGQFSGFKSGTAVEFSNGQTMFVYNGDFNRKTVTLGGETAAVPYNCVLVLNGSSIKGVVKVAPDAEGASGFTAGNVSNLSAQTKSAFDSAWDACSTAYKISDVRSVLADGGAKGKIAYGLPSSYGELYSWIKIYPKQFNYPDYNNAYANFHTDLIVQAIIYELTWNGNSGWKVAEDRDANVKAVNEALKSVNSADDYKNKFGYAFNYLNDIEPYLNAAYPEFPNPIGVINNKIVGGNALDTDFSDSTVMLAMTTCTSIDSRVDPGSGHSVVNQYSYDAQVFTMDTGCYSDYYIFIPGNSSHVSAAMVVANWLLDPDVQFNWFTQTGNGLSIDLNKEMYGATGKGLGYTVKEYYETSDHRLSTYTLTLSPDRLAEVTVNSDFTPYLNTSITAWTNCVKNSNDPIVKG